MKIYAIMGNGGIIHSYHLIKENAQEKSNQMRKELRYFQVGSFVSTHGVDEKLAIELLGDLPDEVHEVQELEVEE